MSPLAIFFVGPSLLVMLVARWITSRALGMKGVHFLFGGVVENVEAATPGRRAAVVLAGLVSSYLVAGVVFALALIAGGKAVPSTEIDVVPDKPAALAGMQPGDRVVAIAGERVASWDELAAAVARRAGEPTEIVAVRGAEEVRFTITPVGASGQGKIGVRAGMKDVPASAGEVVGAMFAQPVSVLVAAVRGYAQLITGEAVGELVGPVAIVKETARAAKHGARDFLNLVAVMLAYSWPFTALLAIVFVPRKATSPRRSPGERP